MEKISDCFVFWKDHSSRTVGVNTLVGKDADAFLAACSAPPSPSAMLQHNTMAEVGFTVDSLMKPALKVSEFAVWRETRLERRDDIYHTTMVSSPAITVGQPLDTVDPEPPHPF